MFTTGQSPMYNSLHNSNSLWSEERGGPQSMGSLRVQHDWATSLSLFTFMHWGRQWQPTPVFLPGESQGLRSLAGLEDCIFLRICPFLPGYPFYCHTVVHNGEGNGNPLQCSCLENPRDGGAWWAAVYGVAQSRTRLKRLSSSSSSSSCSQ